MPGPWIGYAKAARSVLALVASLALAALAGWLLGVRPGEAIDATSRMAPWALLACLASAFGVLALQALRWWAVMRPLLGLRYGDAYRAQIVGAMFNAILPYRAGDLLRVQYLGRRTGTSRATILGTEIVDRWIDWCGWIPTFLLVCAFSSPSPWLVRALGVFCAALLLLAAAMALVMRRGGPVAGSRFRASWASFQTGIAAFRAPRTWLVALVVAPLPWLWEALTLTLASRGLGFDLGFAAAFGVMVGFNLAMVVPSPGALGAVEAGGAAVLVLLGADRSVAVAWMLAYHLTQLLPGIAGGTLVLFLGRDRLAEPRAENS